MQFRLQIDAHRVLKLGGGDVDNNLNGPTLLIRVYKLYKKGEKNI